ncbi:hypothetical protein [Saccharopolyspora pogona]|uniref:hypothetical protein n=1 Tax=Saccharopolyspora pogona TaxID=333966 RepID=UPI001689DEB4|nr:hypothetical protein [Saccharopolyspora pogona]
MAIWGCLECSNAVYTTRHLPSLLAFTGFLDAQREELSEAEWRARRSSLLAAGVAPFPPAGADISLTCSVR